MLACRQRIYLKMNKTNNFHSSVVDFCSIMTFSGNLRTLWITVSGLFTLVKFRWYRRKICSAQSWNNKIPLNITEVNYVTRIFNPNRRCPVMVSFPKSFTIHLAPDRRQRTQVKLHYTRYTIIGRSATACTDHFRSTPFPARH